jgi:hypothetical protein
MNLGRKLVFILLVSLAFETQIFAKAWRGITPLHSTAQDLQRLLGPPLAKDHFGIHYESRKEIVEITLTGAGNFRSLCEELSTRHGFANSDHA